jgi:hypothetical protein
MDTSRQQMSDTQFPGGFFASLQVVSRPIQWLIGLVQLTEEEQKEAGICYPGNQGDSEYSSPI